MDSLVAGEPPSREQRLRGLVPGAHQLDVDGLVKVTASLMVALDKDDQDSDTDESGPASVRTGASKIGELGKPDEESLDMIKESFSLNPDTMLFSAALVGADQVFEAAVAKLSEDELELLDWGVFIGFSCSPAVVHALMRYGVDDKEVKCAIAVDAIRKFATIDETEVVSDELQDMIDTRVSEAVSALFEEGYDVEELNTSQGFPLINALSGLKVPKSLKLLLDKGADPNAVKDAESWSPIMYAVSNNDFDSVELLLAAGASAARQNVKGEHPLMYAESAKMASILVEWYLSHGADLNLSNEDGTNAAHWAAEDGKLEVLKVLYDAGADMNAVDLDNQTPLDRARDTDATASIEFLENLPPRGKASRKAKTPKAKPAKASKKGGRSEAGNGSVVADDEATARPKQSKRVSKSKGESEAAAVAQTADPAPAIADKAARRSKKRPEKKAEPTPPPKSSNSCCIVQ